MNDSSGDNERRRDGNNASRILDGVERKYDNVNEEHDIDEEDRNAYGFVAINEDEPVNTKQQPSSMNKMDKTKLNQSKSKEEQEDEEDDDDGYKASSDDNGEDRISSEPEIIMNKSKNPTNNKSIDNVNKNAIDSISKRDKSNGIISNNSSINAIINKDNEFEGIGEKLSINKGSNGDIKDMELRAIAEYVKRLRQQRHSIEKIVADAKLKEKMRDITATSIVGKSSLSMINYQQTPFSNIKDEINASSQQQQPTSRKITRDDHISGEDPPFSSSSSFKLFGTSTKPITPKVSSSSLKSPNESDLKSSRSAISNSTLQDISKLRIPISPVKDKIVNQTSINQSSGRRSNKTIIQHDEDDHDDSDLIRAQRKDDAKHDTVVHKSSYLLDDDDDILDHDVQAAIPFSAASRKSIGIISTSKILDTPSLNDEAEEVFEKKLDTNPSTNKKHSQTKKEKITVEEPNKTQKLHKNNAVVELDEDVNDTWLNDTLLTIPAKNDNGALILRVETLQDELKRSRNEVTRLETELSNARMWESEARNELIEADKMFDTLRDRIIKIESELEEKNKMISRLSEKIKTIYRKKEMESSKKEEEESKFKASQAKIDVLNTTIETLELKIKKLTKVNLELEKKVSSSSRISTETADMMNELHRARRTIIEQNRIIQENEKTRKRLEKIIYDANS